MLPVLYQLFPNDFHRLVEVFGGGAAVIFGREPGRCEEIYNDYNSNLVTLFWCVKNRPLALMTELNFLPLNSRQEFEVLRKFLREEEFTDAYLREELELCERFFLPPEREELREIILKKGGDERCAPCCRLLQGDPVQLCRERDLLRREAGGHPPGAAPDLGVLPKAGGGSHRAPELRDPHPPVQ